MITMVSEKQWGKDGAFNKWVYGKLTRHMEANKTTPTPIPYVREVLDRLKVYM